MGDHGVGAAAVLDGAGVQRQRVRGNADAVAVLVGRGHGVAELEVAAAGAGVVGGVAGVAANGEADARRAGHGHVVAEGRRDLDIVAGLIRLVGARAVEAQRRTRVGDRALRGAVVGPVAERVDAAGEVVCAIPVITSEIAPRAARRHAAHGINGVPDARRQAAAPADVNNLVGGIDATTARVTDSQTPTVASRSRCQCRTERDRNLRTSVIAWLDCQFRLRAGTLRGAADADVLACVAGDVLRICLPTR